MNSRGELVTVLYGRFDHEDFDGLLEESSLSTIAAKKNQAETPIEIYQRVQDHLRASEVACRQSDVDDFLLHLVRLYSMLNDTDPTSSALVNTAFSDRLWMLRRGLRWCWDSSKSSSDLAVPSRSESQDPSYIVDFACHVRADVVPGIVQTLLDKEVFSYLRQDVARSMVTLCFNSRAPLPLVILNACASAVPASSFRDELADEFMNMMSTDRTALLTGSWLTGPNEQNAIYRTELRARKQAEQALVMTRPMKYVDVTAQSPQLEDPRNVADLMACASDGEPPAWEELISRYGRLVRSTVASFRLQEADAEHAVQNTWLRLMERMDTIRDPRCLGGWLATTASRECLALIRRRHRETPDDAAAKQLVAVDAGPKIAFVGGGAARSAVNAALDELAQDRQLLIRALFYEPDCRNHRTWSLSATLLPGSSADLPAIDVSARS